MSTVSPWFSPVCAISGIDWLVVSCQLSVVQILRSTTEQGAVATWPFRYYSRKVVCGETARSTLNYRTGSGSDLAVSVPLKKGCVWRNGQVATAPCSVGECWLAHYSSRAVELLEEAARARHRSQSTIPSLFAGSIQYLLHNGCWIH